MGCEPVPNAKPGSRVKFIASGLTASCHVGMIHTLSKIEIGLNCS